MLRRIIGLILAIIGAVILLSIFNIIDIFDVSLIAAIVLVGYQIFTLVMNKIKKTHPIFGTLIPFILMIPGLVFFAAYVVDINANILSVSNVLIGAFLITEGLYSLH